MIETEDSLISPLQTHRSDSAAVRAELASLVEDDADFPEIVIQPQPGWVAIDWKEMFEYRELVSFLIWRDISVRYKQTVLGSAWAILHPLMLMLIFTFFFGRLVSAGFDLRLMSSESDGSRIPTSGQNLVIVADLKGVLHFHIFDADGKVVVDTDATSLPTKAGPIADLKQQFDSLRPPHELTRSEKDRVIAAVTSIVGHTLSVKVEGVPYPVFIFAALIPWTLFSQGFPAAALSLASQQNLLTKVYFPRLFVPIAAASVFLVDLAYSLGIYAFVLLYYQVTPSWTVIFVPLLIVVTLIATLSLGVMLSALTVFYRDFRHLVPFLVMIFMYSTPVFYPAHMIPLKYHWFLALNPMFGLVSAYRSAILGLPWHFQSLAISTASALITFLVAVYYFRRTERRFADFA
jgi:ABC-type polysaccharide/polyol phosphate export permease